MGVLVFGALFQRSARTSNSQVTLAEQINLADSTMAEIRDWASLPANYDSDWSFWDGRTVTNPQYTSVQAIVRCTGAGRDLISPSSELETNYPPALARTLGKGVVPVEITVTGPSVQPLVVSSQVSPAIRPIAPGTNLSVSVASGTIPIARGSTAEFSAQLTDSAGVVIPNVTVDWFLLPQTGNGTLLLSTSPRNGSVMGVRNEFRLPNASIGYAPGEIRLRARVRYHGQLIENGDPANLPDTVVGLQ